MELSRFERLVLWNQYEMLRLSGKGDCDYYAKCQIILSSGFEGEYEYVANIVHRDVLSISECSFVSDVLNMFDALSRIGELGGEKLDTVMSKFSGFDGNSETELMSYANFLIEKQQKWTYLGIKNFNSHMPMRRSYDRMLSVFKSIPLAEQFSLTFEQGNSILEARAAYLT